MTQQREAKSEMQIKIIIHSCINILKQFKKTTNNFNTMRGFLHGFLGSMLNFLPVLPRRGTEESMCKHCPQTGEIYETVNSTFVWCHYYYIVRLGVSSADATYLVIWPANPNQSQESAMEMEEWPLFCGPLFVSNLVCCAVLICAAERLTRYVK